MKINDKTHISYPNTNYCLGLQKGSKLVRVSDAEYEVLPSGNYRSYLTGIYQKPISIHYRGGFSEVCIDFEPLGLEMLTGVKISDNTFIPDVIEAAFPQYLSEIYDLAFGCNDQNFCAAKLEEFFLANLPDKNKFEYFAFNENKALQVDDLREIYHKSYRSIHRFYKDSLNISPKEFLNLRRLRRSIRQIHSANKLTNIAYDVGFSDQAHFTGNFKKYTGLPPKIFRRQSSLIDKTLCWTRN